MSKEIDILCLMGLFPKEYENEILKCSKGAVQNAANKFQWSIVNGLDQHEGVNVTIANSLYIGSYPKRYSKMKIPTFKFQHSKSSEDINIGFNNLSLYKMFSRYCSIKKYIKKWINKDTKNQKVVLAYAMATPFVEILYYIKKICPEIICCLVVPDLPEYMNVTNNDKKLYRLAKQNQVKYFKHKLEKIDGYIFLTKYMEEWFDFKVCYKVIEGITDVRKDDNEIVKKKNEQKTIVYAGAIEEKYGVLELVKSFNKIDKPEWNLELFGIGTSLSIIEQIAKEDKRIHINGLVPNKTVVNEEKNADILINPRNDEYEFTKYSFPSKTIEYMTTGTPMIGYKLSGMPEEYRNYFYEISNCEDGMKKTLMYVMGLSDAERETKGRKAKQFVINQKNAKKQCEKIVELINEINSKGE